MFSFVISYLFTFSPEDGAKENAVNVTLTSKASTEPTANEFQDFVSDMQKTITSLRKQVGFPGYDLNDTHSLKLPKDQMFSSPHEYISYKTLTQASICYLY